MDQDIVPPEFEQRLKNIEVRRDNALSHALDATLRKSYAERVRLRDGLRSLIKDATNDLPGRLQEIAGAFIDSLENRDLSLDESGVMTAEHVLQHRLLEARGHVHSIVFALNEFADRKTPNPTFDEIRAACSTEYVTLAGAAYSEVLIDFRHKLSSRSKVIAASNDGAIVHQQNIYGNVGVLVSGQNNTTEIILNIGSEGNSGLRAAFDTLVGCLQSAGNSGTAPVGETAEIIEVSQDAAVEIRRDKPNKLRLKSIVQTLVGSADLIAKIPSAYSALQMIAVAFGIPLPHLSAGS